MLHQQWRASKEAKIVPNICHTAEQTALFSELPIQSMDFQHIFNVFFGQKKCSKINGRWLPQFFIWSPFRHNCVPDRVYWGPAPEASSAVALQLITWGNYSLRPGTHGRPSSHGFLLPDANLDKFMLSRYFRSQICASDNPF